jgi:hypothetical protein
LSRTIETKREEGEEVEKKITNRRPVLSIRTRRLSPVSRSNDKMVAGGRHVFFDWHTIYIVFRLLAGHDGTNWKIVAGEARKKRKGGGSDTNFSAYLTRKMNKNMKV